MRSVSTFARPRVLLAAGCAAAVLGCAAKESPPPPPPQSAVVQSGPGSVAAMATTTATVDAIDHKTRKVTLRTSEGEKVSFVAGDEVRNLDQVRKGDLVTIGYYESLALALRPAKGEKPAMTVTESTERAPVGAQPAAVVAREVVLTAKISKIDRPKSRVTLVGPEGNAVTLKVEDPTKLENVKVGELVEARYKEAMAVTVTKPE
jgi:hypothetical protein